MVAVVLARDPEVGAACAAELRVAPGPSSGSSAAAARAEVHEVATVDEVRALVDGGAVVDVVVAVPPLPVPGIGSTGDALGFLADVEAVAALVLPAMAERGAGRLVLVVTATGLPGQSWADHTGAAMWGLVGVARSAARELAARSVTVNVVRVGVVETERLRQAVATDAAVADQVDAVVAATPLRRTVPVDHVAAAVGYLASAAASYVTGIVLPVDGGLTIGLGA